MEWNKFTESKREYPEELVEKSIQGFSKATSNLLEIEVSRVSEFAGNLYLDFEFRVLLLSNSLKSYKFEVFRFGYNVDLFPVKLILDETIFEELFSRKMRHREKVSSETEDKFRDALINIFNSHRFSEVVSGLMKISRKHLG